MKIIKSDPSGLENQLPPGRIVLKSIREWELSGHLGIVPVMKYLDLRIILVNQSWMNQIFIQKHGVIEKKVQWNMDRFTFVFFSLPICECWWRIRIFHLWKDVTVPTPQWGLLPHHNHLNHGYKFSYPICTNGTTTPKSQ